MAAARHADRAPAPGSELAALSAYYRSPDVRARIAEYCGGHPDDVDSFSALALGGYGGARGLRQPDGAPVNLLLVAWERLLAEGADVCRSLADRVGTLLLLDVDYTNHDDEAEPYRDPARTFARLEPVYHAAQEAFRSHGVRPLVLMTGRGYHFVVKTVRGTPFHTALVRVGAAATTPRPRRERRRAGTARSLADESAHEGAGRLIEHLAHEVQRAVAGGTEVPVTVIDMPPPGGGPFICLDISAYGDALAVRNVRCAFAGNQKALVKELDVRPRVVLTLPRGDEPLDDLLRIRARPGEARELAADAHTRVPAALGGAEWLGAYGGSPLARFHRCFDAGPEIEPRLWPATYDGLDLTTIPGCAALPLSLPNPALLVPGRLRTVALALWAQGWHPRSIAALVRSRYLRPEVWGDYWRGYDPDPRARFYVRVCCGALAAGVEGREAFTCALQRQRGLCPGERCGFDLRTLWDQPRPRWEESR